MEHAKLAFMALLCAVSGAAAASPGTSSEVPTVTVSAGSYTGPNSGEAYQNYTVSISTKTRAQVMQEYVDARRNGEIFDGESYPGPFVLPMAKTRAQVAAETRSYLAARPRVADQYDYEFTLTR